MITKNMKKVERAFAQAGFEVRIVGGAVRDFLMGKQPKDIDMCTDATVEEMQMIASKNNMRLIETGIDHGTVTFVIGSDQFEITTLRIDTETDGRHAKVEFTRSFELDAARRDLTINSMSMDFAGNIFDYFGGQDDIKSNRVRFVGDADARMKEDFLRILRFFRFMARFDASADFDTMTAVEKNADGLKEISKERIWSEVSKIFESATPVTAFQMMRSFGVTSAIGLPVIASSHKLMASDCAEASVAHFFHGNPKDAEEFCKSWKMSSAETKKVVWLAANATVTASDHGVKAFMANGVARDWVVSWCVMQDFPVDTAMTFVVPKFPFNGNDMMAMGFTGKQVGDELKKRKDAWIESRFRHP